MEKIESMISGIKSLRSCGAIIWGGDINCDRLPNNDNMLRPDLRVITPIMDEIINRNNLAQLNFDSTWHRPGKKSSLLDLFYTDRPERVSNVQNVTNICSEHDGVSMTYDMKVCIRSPQFQVIRKYQNFVWTNVETDIQTDADLQSLFSETSPDVIAAKLLRGLNRVIRKHVFIKRIQIKKSSCPYWNEQLSESLAKVKQANKVSNVTGSVEHEREAKHLRNTHTRLMKKAAKEYNKNRFKNKMQSIEHWMI